MTAIAASRFLDMRALSALEHMRFTTRHRIEGTYSGRHASRQLGGAGEFVDYREYAQGEDLRRLDWKVFARTDKAYVLVRLSLNVRRWVQAPELDSGVSGGESPVRATMAGVSIILPGLDLCVEFLRGGEPAVCETLAGQQAQLHLRHI